MSSEKDSAFDPYHKWLGISKAHRPVTFYLLLGLSAGELDVEVIEEAAIRQTTHLRAYQVGAHAAECTRLLNEVAMARQVLVNPIKRKEYDAKLAQLAAKRGATKPASTKEKSAAHDDPDHAVSTKPMRAAAKTGKGGKASKDFDDDETPAVPRVAILAIAAASGVILVGAAVLLAVYFTTPAALPPHPPEPPPAFAVNLPNPARVAPNPVVDSKPVVVQPAPPAKTPIPADTSGGFRLLKSVDVKSPVVNLIPTRDGRVVYGDGSTIHQVDPTTGRHLFSLSWPNAGSTGVRVAVSPDCRKVYVAYPDANGLDVYELAENGQKLGSFVGAGRVGVLEMSRDGTMLLTGGPDGNVVVWNTATREPVLHFKKHSGAGLAIGFSRDGTYAGSLCQKTIQVWNVREKQLVRGGNNIVQGTMFDFSADGESMIVSTPIGLMSGSTKSMDFANIIPNTPFAFVASVDERSFFGMTKNGLGLFEWPSGKTLRTAKVPIDSLQMICLSPDGRLGFVGRVGNRIDVFGTDDRAALRPFEPSQPIPGDGAAYLGSWHFPIVPSQTEIDIEVQKNGDVLSAQIKVRRLTLTGKAQVDFLRMTDKLRGHALREGELPSPWTTLREIVFDHPDAGGQMKVTFRSDGESTEYAFSRPERRIKDPTAKPVTPAVPITPMPPAVDPVPVVRADPPSDEKVKKLTQTIRDTCKADYAKKTPADRAELAEKLLKLAAESKDDPAAIYVLTSEARDLAAAAGKWSTVADALDQLDASFKVDLLAMRETAIQTLLKSGPSKESAQAAAEAALHSIAESVAADRLPLAGKFQSLASTAATKGASPPHVVLVKKADAELKLIVQEAELVRKARETLTTMPNDAAANLAVGRYDALRRNDWSTAITPLAKGGEGELAALVRKEETAPTDGVARLALGDEWWALAAKEKDGSWSRTALQNRAGHWYRLAAPQLTGLNHARATDRLKTIDETPSPFRVAGSAGVAAGSAASAEPKVLHGHKGAITSLKLSADGKRLFSGSLDSTVKTWDVKLARNLTTLPIGTPILSIGLSPNNRFIALGFKGSMRVVDLQNPAATRGMPSGKAVPGAFWADNDKVSYFDGNKHQLVGITDAGSSLPMSMPLRAFEASPTRNKVITLGDETWVFTAKEDGDLVKRHKAPLVDSTAAAFSPARHVVAVATLDKKISLYDFEDRSVALTLDGSENVARCLAYLPSGERLFSGGEDGIVHVWDVTTGKQVRQFPSGARSVTSLLMLSETKQLVTGGSDGVIRIWPEKY